jgi:hypothetical protein
MKIFFSPCVNSKRKINYSFNGEIITAIIDGISDIFDFSNMPDGELDDFETKLPYLVIIHAERINGILSVQLLNFINDNASYEEKFPTWLEV